MYEYKQNYMPEISNCLVGCNFSKLQVKYRKQFINVGSLLNL